MKYLVEIHTDWTHTDHPIRYHKIVESIGPHNAFTDAMVKYEEETGAAALYTSAELEEKVPDFLWTAGSTRVWIEVRKVS